MGVGGAGVGAGGGEVESTPSQPMKRRLLELGGVQVSERHAVMTVVLYADHFAATGVLHADSVLTFAILDNLFARMIGMRSNQ